VSISEIAAILFQEMALPLDEDVAYNLYTGIASATNNYSPQKVSYLSLQSAQWLIKFNPGKANLAQSTGQSQSQSQSQSQLSTAANRPSVQDIEYKPDYASGLNQVEPEKTKKDWLKPPKIYKG